MYRDIFKNKHTILPVIHVENNAQTLHNVLIAKEEGADGVFLINHGIDSSELSKIHEFVINNVDFWVGLNYLGTHNVIAFCLANENKYISGIWTDNAEIDERFGDNQFAAKSNEKARISSGFQGLYFGGVAFKYQKPVTDLVTVAKIATQYMDVITTSGPGTGHAADIEKIKTMKSAIGDFPLAIASGITPENVENYMDFADCFLVATGISDSFTMLNREKLRSLIKKVR